MKQVMWFDMNVEIFKVDIVSWRKKKVLVLNKFLTLEGRINTLIDILPVLNFNPEALLPESRKVLENLLKPQS